MARILNLRLKNFRCFKDFEASFGNEHFIVLIGRGDSGKSSILKAIDALLSPQWNYPFTDWDFYNGDVTNPIVIEGDIIELSEELLSLDTVQFNYKLLRQDGSISTDIRTEKNNDIPLITLRLIVDETLEPQWYIVSGRDGVSDIELHSKDRELFKSFMIADTNDLQFSYHRQSPLITLANNTKKERDIVNHKMISVVRAAFQKGKEISSFEEFNESAEQVKSCATKFGVDGNTFDAQLDYKENAYTLRNVGLHKDNQPCRLLGNGSKRLISMAIQLELTKQGGIVLVDEIEQGLEPDRLLSIIQLYKNNKCGQMILTTHSPYVVCECNHSQLLRVKPNHTGIWNFESNFASILRTIPEIFFAKRVILCEGKTELGFLRAIDDSLRKTGMGFGRKGIVLANCKGGATFYKNAELLCKQNIDVCILCDNDDQNIEKYYRAAEGAGATIIRWDKNNCLEQQIFKDVSYDLTIELVKLAQTLNPTKNINNELNITQDELEEKKIQDIDDFRSKIGNTAKNSGWFKDIDKAQSLAEIILDKLEFGFIPEKTILHQRLTSLFEWINK